MLPMNKSQSYKVGRGEPLDDQPSTSANAMARLLNGPYAQNEQLMEEDVNSITKECNSFASTCTIVIGGIKHKCDLRLLQRCCLYFRKRVGGTVFVLPVSQVNCRSFSILYAWVRKMDLVVAPKDLVSLYVAAKFLGARSLTDQFMAMFSDPNIAREEIGFHMFFGLCKWNLSGPYRSMLRRVHKYFLTMIATLEFFELDGGTVMSLLKSTSICVNSEMEVLMAALFWLLYDYNCRGDWLVRLMSCVRYTCIPETAIEQLRATSSSDALVTLLCHPKLQALLGRTRHITSNNIQHGDGRIWIYDELSCYHHDANCAQRNHFTLDQFRDFQRVLNVAPSLHWYERLSLNPYATSCRNPQCRSLQATAFRN